MSYPIKLDYLCINCGYDKSFHEDEMGKLHDCMKYKTVKDLRNALHKLVQIASTRSDWEAHTWKFIEECNNLSRTKKP